MDLNMKVLVVDDFATMRRILRNILKQIGFKNIIEADDGKSALKELKKEKVDLIMCDWNMPEMPGIEPLQKVCHRTPCIVLENRCRSPSPDLDMVWRYVSPRKLSLPLSHNS